MLETIAAYIERHQLLPASGNIVVAVSGGADSLCLLHLLHQLCGPGKRYPGLRLHVAHLNHKLRGEASAQDATTVAQIAAAWGLPATIGELDVPALAQQEHRSLEDAARTARYRFLRQVADGQPIAVAHHADDQVETILLHYLRGGGLTGMIGMQPRQQDIIRPLLEVTHAQTLAYCQQHHIIPLEDASNTDPRFLRNRIRHELLPLLESLNSGIRTTLVRNAEVMRIDLAWIDAQLDACWSTVIISEQEHSISLKLQAFLALPQSLQRHLLRRITARLCAGQSPLELRHYLLIEQLLHPLSDASVDTDYSDEPVGADVSCPPPIDRPMTTFETIETSTTPVGADSMTPIYRPPSNILDLPHHLHLTRYANEITFERLQGSRNPQETLPYAVPSDVVDYLSPRQDSSFSASARCIMELPLAATKLTIPGHVKVPGTPWTATAETLSVELLQKVQQALSREDWPQVWQLLPSTLHTIYVDADAVGSQVYVRTRQPGDRIRPLGMAHEKKVQDILVDKHIARSDRPHIPLFFSDAYCIWLAGICIDDRVRLTTTTRHILRLSITM